MKNTLLFLVSFLAAIVFVEVVLDKGYFVPSFELFDLQIVLDKNSLYTVKPKSRPDINQYGYRDESFSLSKNKKKILALGDSFTMALNVPPEKSFPKIIDKKMGADWDVYNMGIIGYGPDQVLARLPESMNFSPDIVLLSIFAANDFQDIIKNNIFRLSHGALHRSALNPVEKFMTRFNIVYFYKFVKFKILQNRGVKNKGTHRLFALLFGDSYDHDFMVDRQSAIAKEKIDLMRSIIHEIKSECNKKGSSLMIAVIPSLQNIADPDYLKKNDLDPAKRFLNENIVEEICTLENIKVINLYKYFLQSPETMTDLFDFQDGHLSEYGNEKVGQIIQQNIVSTFNTQ